MKIFDLKGREVSTLVDRREKAGYYTVNWQSGNLATGVYFYHLKAGAFSQTRQVMLLK